MLGLKIVIPGYDWMAAAAVARGRREDMRESVRGNCDDANLVSGT